jgi:hypothetical protein
VLSLYLEPGGGSSLGVRLYHLSYKAGSILMHAG